ncbi:MAG: 3'-5' exonuclease [Oscillospiraceae bacterium]|nr:3'-5' exonuclease [Oscillospiraceae bacterium]
MKLLFFDTETTDKIPGNICQLSYIVVDTDTKPQTTIGKNYFFAVDEMSPEAEKVHGFSLLKLYELSQGKYIEDLINEFMDDFLNADVLIGHNVSFDINFLTSEFSSLGIDFKPKSTFCTMNYYKNICKIYKPNNGTYKFPRLSEVINFLNISDESVNNCAMKLFGGTNNYHDARFDTAALYLIVTNGIKKGLVPKGYFTKKIRK